MNCRAIIKRSYSLVLGGVLYFVSRNDSTCGPRGSPRSQMADGWWLVAGGWWLVAGSWWLVACTPNRGSSAAVQHFHRAA
jgi:hypothetical protein